MEPRGRWTKKVWESLAYSLLDDDQQRSQDVTITKGIGEIKVTAAPTAEILAAITVLKYKKSHKIVQHLAIIGGLQSLIGNTYEICVTHAKVDDLVTRCNEKN
jgi:hypothetical protein